MVVNLFTYHYSIILCLISFSVLPIAMDRAVKEIVSSIVQRSVSIATQTTKELVLKVSLFPIAYSERLMFQ